MLRFLRSSFRALHFFSFRLSLEVSNKLCRLISKSSNKLATDQLGRLICEIRSERVMLDSDLASIYGVETKGLNRAWDRQIEADAKAGRLDHLWAEAMEDIKAGRTKPLDDVLDDE